MALETHVLSSRLLSHLCSYLSVKDKAVLPKGRNKRESSLKGTLMEKKEWLYWGHVQKGMFEW